MPNLIGGIVLGYIWQLIFNGILAKYSTALALNQWLGFWGLIILYDHVYRRLESDTGASL